jgi:hypothetical protein
MQVKDATNQARKGKKMKLTQHTETELREIAKPGVHAGYQDMPPCLQKLARQQPGYRSGCACNWRQTMYGGIRLYTEIGGRWMDASLEDVAKVS